MKFRTILIDDEPLALSRLNRLLEPHGETVEIIGCARNGPEAVERIDRLHPDLVFLDIRMPGMNGFDVLGRISVLPLVIFCTAYDEYALQAFETNSIDYLVKPVEPERLEKTMEKLRRFTGNDRNEITLRLENLLACVHQSPLRRIPVRQGESIYFLNVSDICFFRALDRYVEVRTVEKSYLLSRTLRDLEDELPPEDFVRIHRSAIINVNYLEKIVRWFGGGYRVRMRDKSGTELEVSRGFRHNLGI